MAKTVFFFFFFNAPGPNRARHILENQLWVTKTQFKTSAAFDQSSLLIFNCFQNACLKICQITRHMQWELMAEFTALILGSERCHAYFSYTQEAELLAEQYKGDFSRCLFSPIPKITRHELREPLRKCEVIGCRYLFSSCTYFNQILFSSFFMDISEYKHCKVVS